MVGGRIVKVTREVINDLIPAYLVGEASEDSRALVEEFLRGDPEFAALVRNEQSIELLKQPITLAADHEKQSLTRLKRLIKLQTWFLALALFFSVVPFSVKIEDGSIRFFMLQNTSWLAAIYWSIAALFWLGYFLIRRRLRVGGI
jgi:hypothetical protein